MREPGPSECLVVAEVGSNHDGDERQAHTLIDVAADAGAGGVKFQLFRAATLYPRNCGTVPAPDGRSIDFYRELERHELPLEWLPDLVDHCADRGVEPLCSPFDEAMADSCVEAGFTGLKVASPELTHLPLLRHIATLGHPVILSTGMSTLGDIQEALDALSGAPAVTLLHCVTAYPCPESEANLAAIETLRASFGPPVGLSDHTADAVAAPIIAATLGATVLEKHVTTSRHRAGLDHSFAIEPDELAALVDEVAQVGALDPAERYAHAVDRLGLRRVERLLGDPRKKVTRAEVVLAATDRRALHALTDIEPGDVLTEANVGVLRGERNLPPGLHPRWLEWVLGAAAQRLIPYGHGVSWDDLLVRPT